MCLGPLPLPHAPPPPHPPPPPPTPTRPPSSALPVLSPWCHMPAGMIAGQCPRVSPRGSLQRQRWHGSANFSRSLPHLNVILFAVPFVVHDTDGLVERYCCSSGGPATRELYRAQELCQSRGGRPGSPRP